MELRLRAANNDWPAAPEPGSHPHAVRQWLLSAAPFPPKWINGLFSIGGIAWSPEGRILLHAFPPPKSSGAMAGTGARAVAGSLDQLPGALFSDDYCLVMNKPVGMPVHESVKGQKGTLDEAASAYLAIKGDPLPARHIHRLDADTSGPVLYSTNDLSQLRLDEAMRRKDIGRHYIAVVHGMAKSERGTVEAPIGKDRHKAGRRRVTPGGEAAVTHYECIARQGGYSLLRLTLETGRTHQIRVHMSHIGHPLVGDALYGGRVELLPHQALHGEKIIFPHPLTGEACNVSSPWPHWLDGLTKRLGLRAN
ncbi:RluA family pseudouridine synthase [Paenibacillus sp. CAU 1782]